MSHVASAPTLEPTPQNGRPATSIPPALASGLDFLVGTLLLIAAARSVIGHAPGWEWVVLCATAVGAVYAVGTRVLPAASTPSGTRWWLLLLLSVWAVLLVLTPDAIYLAFAWFFLLLHLLSRPAGLSAVLVTTAAAVAGFAWHQSTFTAGMVIGPVLGAGVAVSTVFGYQALRAESEQRRRLIIELDRTRHELSAAQHRAGVLNERERLAREIHDTLAQGFSSIQLLLQAANRSLDPTRGLDPARA
ncbi:MAG: histidine kinase, partial [Humibacillus sp.]